MNPGVCGIKYESVRLCEGDSCLYGMTHIINIKRAYEPASESDGYRVYVDRLWPRGLSHETFKYDLWDKDIAPSTELREWFHADPASRWDEFGRRYRAELASGSALGALRRELASRDRVTLLYSSHDSEHNNAAVLRDVLEKA